MGSSPEFPPPGARRRTRFPQLPADSPAPGRAVMACAAKGTSSSGLRRLGFAVFGGRPQRLLAASAPAAILSAPILLSGPSQDELALVSQLLAPCVDIALTGARNTRENARDLAVWARSRDLDIVVLATCSWHMPRALAMARAAWPGGHVVPLSVGGTPRRWSEPIKFHLVKVWLALTHSARRFAHQPPWRRAEATTAGPAFHRNGDDGSYGRVDGG